MPNIEFLKTHGLRVVCLFLVFYYPERIMAQAEVRANCLQPYGIDLSKDRDMTTKHIRYRDHDDHTFWYRINTEEAERFSYRVRSLDDQENFDIYFYQYEGANFCRNLIQDNLELVAFEDLPDFKTDKRSTYYLGVYPLFPGGCGHKLVFTYGGREMEVLVENNQKSCVQLDDKAAEEQVVESGVNVHGMVRDKITGNGINASLTFVDPFSSGEVRVRSTEDEGYQVQLEEDGDYKVRVRSFGYRDTIAAIAAYEGGQHDFELGWSAQREYVLNNVYFYPNTYALKEESREELEGVYSFLKNRDDVRIEILGHTNGDKDVKAGRVVMHEGEEWNFTGTARELSYRRAHKILKYLESRGIDIRWMEARGMGGAEMIVPDPSNMKEAMKNIRVEIKVLPR